MKASLNCLLLGLIGFLLLATPRASARLEVSGSVTISAAADFHVPLAPHGAWVEVDTYGRCWRPSGIAVTWRPYCHGEWVWTDHGWYWESDEPWAWATYHYGRWVYHPRHYWVWVPGTEWAPAWVSWRSGGGYVGWAPLPPTRLTVSFGFRHPEFVFVQSARFHQPIRHNTVIVNNTTIINKTKIVSREPVRETRTVEGSRKEVYVNKGPQPDELEKATGRKAQALPIQQVAARAAVPESVKTKPANPAKSADKEKPARTKTPDKKDPPAPKPNPPKDKDPVTPEIPKPKPPPERPAPPTPDQPKPVPPPELPKPPVNPEQPKFKPVPELPKPRPAPGSPDRPSVQDVTPGQGKVVPSKPGPSGKASGPAQKSKPPKTSKQPKGEKGKGKD